MKLTLMPLGCHVNVPASPDKPFPTCLVLLGNPSHSISIFIICTVHIMVGVVANYYATKTVDRLEVNGVLLFLSLNVFQPPSCQNLKQKNVPRINESNYFENTHSNIYTHSTSSLLTLQSR